MDKVKYTLSKLEILENLSESKEVKQLSKIVAEYIRTEHKDSLGFKDKQK